MTKRNNKKRKIKKINSNLCKKKVGSKDPIEKPSKISAFLIVKNEIALLTKCIENIGKFADEIIIVDAGSTGKTTKNAESHGAKIYHHSWKNDFRKLRKKSISYASGEWIFVVDGHEELIQWDQSIETVLLNKNIKCLRQI